MTRRFDRLAGFVRDGLHTPAQGIVFVAGYRWARSAGQLAFLVDFEVARSIDLRQPVPGVVHVVPRAIEDEVASLVVGELDRVAGAGLVADDPRVDLVELVGVVVIGDQVAVEALMVSAVGVAIGEALHADLVVAA